MGAEEIKEELAAEFPSLAQQELYLDACAEIGALLEEGPKNDKLAKALRDLDRSMNDLVRSRIDDKAFARAENSGQFGNKSKTDIHREVVNNLGASFGGFESKTSENRKRIVRDLAGATGNKDPFSKVLVPVLEAFESDCGYPGNRDLNFHPRMYYVGFVQREAFLDNIAMGFHWKDVGASPMHGEFTHRIQWYVIAHAGVVEKHKIGDLYRFIGLFREQSENPDSIGQRDLWPRLCDRPRAEVSKGQSGDTLDTSDFRAPEHFNEYLINKTTQSKYPMLSSFLLGRFKKRVASTGEVDFPSEKTMLNYASQKIFDTGFDSLPDLHQTYVKTLTSGPVDSKKPNVVLK